MNETRERHGSVTEIGAPVKFEEKSECAYCGLKFDWKNRRHHCRWVRVWMDRSLVACVCCVCLLEFVVSSSSWLSSSCHASPCLSLFSFCVIVRVSASICGCRNCGHSVCGACGSKEIVLPSFGSSASSTVTTTYASSATVASTASTQTTPAVPAQRVCNVCYDTIRFVIFVCASVCVCTCDVCVCLCMDLTERE